PEEVTGFIGKQRDHSRIVDHFEIILHYTGLKVTLKSGFLVKAHLPKYILLGTEGSFIKYGLDVQEDALKEGVIPTDDEAWRKEPKEIWGIMDTEAQGQSIVESLPGDYRALYENLVLAFQGEEELAVQPVQARNVIRIIELAMQSSEEKRTLPFS
ncbi:MAG: Gfo/Idh/MocA family oxidoreductase, partial [Cyclobacteriaceae bacterium]